MPERKGIISPSSVVLPSGKTNTFQRRSARSPAKAKLRRKPDCCGSGKTLKRLSARKYLRRSVKRTNKLKLFVGRRIRASLSPPIAVARRLRNLDGNAGRIQARS